jgi:hypothetical protein
MLVKFLDLFRYPSTWKGIVTLLTLAGLKIAPDQAEAITQAGLATVGAIWMFFSDADVKAK